MNSSTHGLKKILTALTAAAVLGTSVAHATAVLTIGNVPQTGDQNVLLNTGLTGNPLFGTTNQTGFSVRFTGTEALTAPAAGQARIEAVDGGFNSLMTDLPGASFTSLVLNLDASSNGTILFTTDMTGASPTQTFSATVNESGSNFFTFTTIDGQRYQSISFTSTSPLSLTFADAAQFRIGGAQATTVPDGGATVAMLGLGLVGLFGLRRRLSA
jgi:hypothetical protein